MWGGQGQIRRRHQGRCTWECTRSAVVRLESRSPPMAAAAAAAAGWVSSPAAVTPSAAAAHLHRPVHEEGGRLALHLIEPRILQTTRQAAAERWRPAVEACLPRLPLALAACVHVGVHVGGAAAGAPHTTRAAPASPPYYLARLVDALHQVRAQAQRPDAHHGADEQLRMSGGGVGGGREGVGACGTTGVGGWGWGIEGGTATRCGTAAPARQHIA